MNLGNSLHILNMVINTKHSLKFLAHFLAFPSLRNEISRHSTILFIKYYIMIMCYHYKLDKSEVFTW